MLFYLLIISIFLIIFLLFRDSRRAVLSILLLMGVCLILPVFLKSLRFNLITGGEHLPSRSATKQEAIKRGVYVCDVQLPRVPYEINDSLKLVIKEGWIEESWRGGYWYWTTIKKDKSVYSIRVEVDLLKSSHHDWVIRNDKRNSFGYEQLGYFQGCFSGTLKHLPSSDTLSYNVLRQNTTDFSDQNILGQLEFYLKRD